MPANLPPGGPAALRREQEKRRARLIVIIAVLGIAATLVAYGVSPGVRHAVGKAAHGVSNVFDHDSTTPANTGTTATPGTNPGGTNKPAPQRTGTTSK